MDAPAPADPAASPGWPVWDPEEDDVLVCRAVRQETADVRTFVLAPRRRRRFAFDPGQFLTLEFEIGGETVRRCYTISAPPTRPDTCAITVKRVPGGPVSNWLHDHFRAGMALRATGPSGDFTWARHASPSNRYLLVSGGSGVTPMMSMARSAFDLAEGRDIVFLHAARTPADIVFEDELAHMSRCERSFRVAHLCEADAPGRSWAGLRGRLTPALLEAAAPDFREREVFVCGPAPFMAAVRAALEGANFDMRRHHQESFSFEDLSASQPGEPGRAGGDAAPAARVFRIEFARTRRVLECAEDMPILEAAKRAGMRLPSSCGKGVCGTCKTRKLSGEVEMRHGGGIRQREIDAGQVLLCCARPRSDIVVER